MCDRNRFTGINLYLFNTDQLILYNILYNCQVATIGSVLKKKIELV